MPKKNTSLYFPEGNRERDQHLQMRWGAGVVHSAPSSGSQAESPSSGTDLSNDVLHSQPGPCPRAQAGALQHTCRLPLPSSCGKPRLWMHSLYQGLVRSGLLCRRMEVTETQHQATYVGYIFPLLPSPGSLLQFWTSGHFAQ